MDQIVQSTQHRVGGIFFIVYDARSGSTFLANQLVKKTNIAIPPESNFMALIVKQYEKDTIDDKRDLARVLEIMYAERKFSDWNISAEEILKDCEQRLPISIGNFILSICSLYKNKQFPDADYIGIKKGNMGMYHKRLKKMLPSAKFIVLTRDGRAVFNSQKESKYSETGKPMESDPAKAAQRWSEMTVLFREIEQSYPQDTLKIKYEDLMSEFEKTFDAIKRFLNINRRSTPRVDERDYAVPQRYDTIHQNINKAPMRERIDAWRDALTAEDIRTFESIAHKHLEKEGYKPVNDNSALKLFRIKKKIVNKFRWLKMVKNELPLQ